MVVPVKEHRQPLAQHPENNEYCRVWVHSLSLYRHGSLPVFFTDCKARHCRLLSRNQGRILKLLFRGSPIFLQSIHLIACIRSQGSICPLSLRAERSNLTVNISDIASWSAKCQSTDLPPESFTMRNRNGCAKTRPGVNFGQLFEMKVDYRNVRGLAT